MHRSLLRHKFNAAALHGDMDQPARTAALESFRKGEVTVLVASDVAARGLDIPAVSHIFNFDVPHHPDDYVHRIGRTGRAGLSGTAITIVAPIDGKAVGAIERLIGQTIPWMGEPAPKRARAGRHKKPNGLLVLSREIGTATASRRTNRKKMLPLTKHLHFPRLLRKPRAATCRPSCCGRSQSKPDRA